MTTHIETRPSAPPWVAAPYMDGADFNPAPARHTESRANVRTIERIVPRQSTPGPEQLQTEPQRHGQLAAYGLLKSYQKGPIGIPVLQGVDLSVREGEFVSIIGQSGSGKSTLLHLLGMLDTPDALFVEQVHD